MVAVILEHEKCFGIVIEDDNIDADVFETVACLLVVT